MLKGKEDRETEWGAWDVVLQKSIHLRICYEEMERLFVIDYAVSTKKERVAHCQWNSIKDKYI